MRAVIFSIITPTLQRESLVRCCESVSSQTLDSWEHIIQVDSPDLDLEMLKRVADPRRHVYCCEKRHNNFGNTCRHLAWEQTCGDWIIYLDDDNALADPDALKRIAECLEGRTEMWAVFPIMRHGSLFFSSDPRCCHVDTLNMVIRREVAQWPDRDEYTLDGIFCDELRDRYPFAAFPSVNPIGIMEVSNRGE